MGRSSEASIRPDPRTESGHRGIDIAAPDATLVRAPAAGVVTFAGNVGGRLFVTIDHGGGLLSTCSFLSSLLVHKGDVVVQGQDIARSGTGHVGDSTPNVHLGVRLAGQYVDPMDLPRCGEHRRPDPAGTHRALLELNVASPRDP